MRRFLALLTLLACLIPAARAAELPLPYEESTVLSVLELTATQQALAMHLYGPVFRQEEQILLPEGTRYADVAPAMNCLMQDYPELFHLGRDYAVGYYLGKPEIATYVQPQYRMSAEEAGLLRSQLYARAYLIADANPDPLSLHDTLCSLITYGGDSEMRHTAVGALLEGQATCEGYAQALTLLYRMAGIPCGVVTGTAEASSGAADRHSWNIADIGGCTLIDATWNDQDALNLNTRWYYGLSGAQMAADHTPDAGQALPECGDQAGWHAREGTLIATEEALNAVLHPLTQGHAVNLRFAEPALYDAALRFAQNDLTGGCTIIQSDAQLCVIIQPAE